MASFHCNSTMGARSTAALYYNIVLMTNVRDMAKGYVGGNALIELIKRFHGYTGFSLFFFLEL